MAKKSLSDKKLLKPVKRKSKGVRKPPKTSLSDKKLVKRKSAGKAIATKDECEEEPAPKHMIKLKNQCLVPARPWQNKVINMLRDDMAMGRKILWIYSLKEEMGKSDLARFLVDQQDAVNLEAKKPKDWQKTVQGKLAQQDQFAELPILIMDLPRMIRIDMNTMYETLENALKGPSDYQTWKIPPRIIVFANHPPASQKLSSDRLDVHIITESFELLKDKSAQTAQAAFQAETSDKQKKYEEGARTGERSEWQMDLAAHGKRIAALKRCFKLLKTPNKEDYMTRAKFFQHIRDTEPDAWHTWKPTNVKEQAVKISNNIRADDPFIKAWDSALTNAFGKGHDDLFERDIGSSNDKKRPYHTEWLKKKGVQKASRVKKGKSLGGKKLKRN